MIEIKRLIYTLMIFSLITIWQMLRIIPAAHSAEISVVNTPQCTILLEGYVEQGDADKLREILDGDKLETITNREQSENQTTYFFPVLCLNSEGGNYAEALRIVENFPTHLATLINGGAKCYSACALIFMAGQRFMGTGFGSKPDRWLAPGGEVGFHGPYLEGSAGTGDRRRAHSEGIKAVTRLVEQSVIPSHLLQKLLKVGSDQFLKAESVSDVLSWDIRIAGLKIVPKSISACSVARACVSYLELEKLGAPELLFGSKTLRPEFVPRQPQAFRPGAVQFSKGSHRSIYDVALGRHGEFGCVIDLSISEARGVIVEITEDDTREDALKKAGARPSTESTKDSEFNLGRLAGESTALLLASDAKLRDLATSDGVSKALACSRDDDL